MLFVMSFARVMAALANTCSRTDSCSNHSRSLAASLPKIAADLGVRRGNLLSKMFVGQDFIRQLLLVFRVRDWSRDSSLRDASICGLLLREDVLGP
jgi:hypothetical protein